MSQQTCGGMRALGPCDLPAKYFVHGGRSDRAACGIHLHQIVKRLTEAGTVDVWRLAPEMSPASRGSQRSSAKTPTTEEPT